MKLVYFAWIKDRVGLADEEVALPGELVTVGDLLTWLAGRGENYAAAFETPDVVRVAIDQEHADHDDPIAGAREIALFPPMTGG